MPHADPDNPLQGYFDWQITTLMLAYDLVDPIPTSGAGGEDAAHDRRAQVEQEVRKLSLKEVPREYQDDPQRDWPPEVLSNITRATFRRAVEVIQRGSGSDTTV